MPKVSKLKKLVSVSVTSTSISCTKKEALECVLYIYYLAQFKKNANETEVQTFIDSENEVNAIHPTFIRALCLPIRPIEIELQKIDSTTLDTYGMLVAAFSVINKAN